MLQPTRIAFILTALALAGCLTDEKTAAEATQGEATLLTQEVDDMGATSKSSMAAALLKASADSVGVQADAAVWNADCECFIRTKTITTTWGFTRVRVDSVTFIDAAGAVLRPIQLLRTKTVHHVRAITQSKAGREAQIRIVTDMTPTINGGDTLGTWNGTIVGAFAGEAYKSGTITNVVRKSQGKRWLFPESGTIAVDRLAADWLITFNGATATAVRTGKLTGKSLTVTIDQTYKADL